MAGRRLSNVPSAVQELKRLSSRSARMEFRIIDFVDVSFKEQVAVTAHSDALIGMHGAGMRLTPVLGSIIESFCPNCQSI